MLAKLYEGEINMSIGLKGCWKETKCCSLRYRLKNLIRELRYAWQRAWRGYDDCEVWDINLCFIERYKLILKDYRENHYSLLNVPNEEYRNIFGKLFFNEEETDDIIDTMIFHLEMMNQDYVEKVLYGKNIYDDDYDFAKDFSIEKAMRVSSVVHQNKEAFMRLFNLFFWDLWD
jgi:hypothetical protein